MQWSQEYLPEKGRTVVIFGKSNAAQRERGPCLWSHHQAHDWNSILFSFLRASVLNWSWTELTPSRIRGSPSLQGQKRLGRGGGLASLLRGGVSPCAPPRRGRHCPAPRQFWHPDSSCQVSNFKAGQFHYFSFMYSLWSRSKMSTQYVMITPPSPPPLAA